MRQTAQILGWEFVAIGFDEARGAAQPCVYLMAHEAQPGVHCIHYVGQTQNLGQRLAGHHRLHAAIGLGASHVLAMKVEAECDRRALETLLRYELRPPLNQEDAPTHVQGWRAAIHCGRADLAARARRAHLRGSRPMFPAWANTPTSTQAR